MLKLLLTDKVDKSLEEIIDFYLAEYSANRAEKVVQSLDEAFEKITKIPFSFPICFDIENPQENIRQIIVHSTFKVIYRVQANQIEVLEIFQGNRNDSLLKDIR